MENYNRIDLTIIPIDGVDSDIDCEKCPSACCREEMKLPLSPTEAESLELAGTAMRKLKWRERKFKPAGKGRDWYELESDCGNLIVDQENGTTHCGVFDKQSERPTVCGEFVTGSAMCAVVQIVRRNSGEDIFVTSDQE